MKDFQELIDKYEAMTDNLSLALSIALQYVPIESQDKQVQRDVSEINNLVIEAYSDLA